MMSHANAAGAQEVLTAQKSPDQANFSWYRTVTERVPPLRHDRGKIPPMITWEGFGFEPLTEEQIRALTARGFTQHLRLDEAMIPAAKALQAAGSPVILMQGAGGTWPADQAGDPASWAHRFDTGYKPTEALRPCPAIAAGWAVEADRIRATLRKFKDSGVVVNAVWMDWEGDPLYGKDRFDQARHCARCRETLPPKALASKQAFESYCRRRFVELIGAYLAAPVLEVFPACSVTNWNAMVSTPERPLSDWGEDRIDPSMPAFFTATNPSAYGDTEWWKHWQPTYKRDQEHVDQFWTHKLLQQVSDEAANRLRWMPENPAIPWVARWLPENNRFDLPVMSRERYREVLRHLWLRGVGGMQVFNPRTKGYEQMAVFEVEDAAAVYNEVMAFHDLIETGEPLNLAYPKVQDDATLWSGLRSDDRAVIRVFRQGGGTSAIKVTVWPGLSVTLRADGHGATYLFRRSGNRIQAERIPDGAVQTASQ